MCVFPILNFQMLLDRKMKNKRKKKRKKWGWFFVVSTTARGSKLANPSVLESLSLFLNLAHTSVAELFGRDLGIQFKILRKELGVWLLIWCGLSGYFIGNFENGKLQSDKMEFKSFQSILLKGQPGFGSVSLPSQRDSSLRRFQPVHRSVNCLDIRTTFPPSGVSLDQLDLPFQTTKVCRVEIFQEVLTFVGLGCPHILLTLRLFIPVWTFAAATGFHMEALKKKRVLVFVERFFFWYVCSSLLVFAIKSWRDQVCFQKSHHGAIENIGSLLLGQLLWQELSENTAHPHSRRQCLNWKKICQSFGNYHVHISGQPPARSRSSLISVSCLIMYALPFQSIFSLGFWALSFTSLRLLTPAPGVALGHLQGSSVFVIGGFLRNDVSSPPPESPAGSASWFVQRLVFSTCRLLLWVVRVGGIVSFDSFLGLNIGSNIYHHHQFWVSHPKTQLKIFCNLLLGIVMLVTSGFVREIDQAVFVLSSVRFVLS